MKECKVCGHTLPEAIDGVKTCGYCRTRYDLVNRKVDNTDTMVNTTDCKHRHPLFISGSRWTGDNGSGRYRVSLCPDCGQFSVYGNANGQPYLVRFDLVTDELVTAAGKYLRLLKAEEEGVMKFGEGYVGTEARDDDEMQSKRM